MVVYNQSINNTDWTTYAGFYIICFTFTAILHYICHTQCEMIQLECHCIAWIPRYNFNNLVYYLVYYFGIPFHCLVFFFGWSKFWSDSHKFKHDVHFLYIQKKINIIHAKTSFLPCNTHTQRAIDKLLITENCNNPQKK